MTSKEALKQMEALTGELDEKDTIVAMRGLLAQMPDEHVFEEVTDFLDTDDKADLKTFRKWIDDRIGDDYAERRMAIGDDPDELVEEDDEGTNS